MSRWATAAAGLALAGAMGFGAVDMALTRPTMSSFYARDEGSTIRLKVNFCDYTGSSTDSFSIVFRIFDDSGYQVFNQRVSGRIYGSCGTASVRINDTLPEAYYRANAAVVNRTQGGMVRNQARSFYVY